MTTTESLPCAANRVAQALAEASIDPRGLAPLRCAELAHMLDEALVVGAPIAPSPVVVPIWWGVTERAGQ